MSATRSRARKVRVGRSANGRGVFAERAFLAEEVIGEIRGRIIDDADYGSVYSIDLGGTLTLEPRPPFRYLNHSCRPNCLLFMYEGHADPAEDRRTWLQALRPISPGEELTIDYAWPADAAIPCGCGSEDCRGWIIDSDDLHRLGEA
jgi:hypothetical protein